MMKEEELMKKEEELRKMKYFDCVGQILIREMVMVLMQARKLGTEKGQGKEQIQKQ